MDRVAARNTLIVLVSLVALTWASVGVLLFNYVKDPAYDPPQALIGLVLALVSFLTGTQVTFDAKPSVGAAAEAAHAMVSEIGYQVRESTTTNAPTEPASTVLSGTVQVSAAGPEAARPEAPDRPSPTTGVPGG